MLVGGKESTQVDECPNDLNASANRNGTLEDVCKHDHAVFGEDIWQVLDILPTLQDHNL